MNFPRKDRSDAAPISPAYIELFTAAVASLDRAAEAWKRHDDSKPGPLVPRPLGEGAVGAAGIDPAADQLGALGVIAVSALDDARRAMVRVVLASRDDLRDADVADLDCVVDEPRAVRLGDRTFVACPGTNEDIAAVGFRPGGQCMVLAVVREEATLDLTDAAADDDPEPDVSSHAAELAEEVTSHAVETFRLWRDSLAAACERRDDRDAEDAPADDAEEAQLSKWIAVARHAFRRAEADLARVIYLANRPDAGLAEGLVTGRPTDGWSLRYGRSLFGLSVRPGEAGEGPIVTVNEVDLADVVDARTSGKAGEAG